MKQHDFTFEISTASSRKAKRWDNKPITWSKFKELCQDTERTDETAEEYARMSKDEQSRIKDVGGFVAGHIENGQRKKGNITSRSAATLDLDFATSDIWDEFTLQFSCAALLYSTHKHTDAKPRFRLVIPFSRDVTPLEYEPISRRIAETVGIEYFDSTTHDINRLFYWPSTSKDAPYVYECQDGNPLDVDQLLRTYTNFADPGEWPRSAREGDIVGKAIRMQEDPREKKGIYGTFCRAYTIEEAIEELLPDVYESTAVPGRYTYKAGTSGGGLVCYDGLFAWSHHETDPAAKDGHCHNAFDLVRIHKFGELDSNARPDTPATKMPSFLAMVDFCKNDERTHKLFIDEQHTEINADFGDIDPDELETPEWFADLERDKKGNIEKTYNNLIAIMLNDRKLKRVQYDEFSKNDVTHEPAFKPSSGFLVTDESAGKIAACLEKKYHLSISLNKVFEVLKSTERERGFNPVQDHITAAQWDGTPRIETALIDYLGAEDTPLNRAQTKLWFVAAVARAFEPGTKFDNVLTLPGPQGIGKSTFFRIIGNAWFSDSFSFASSDKEKVEAVTAGWIIEISELNGLKRANDAEAAKAFLSKCIDRIRPAYGHKVEEYPRHSVFAATTNESNFLQGENGNRRWWIIPVRGKGTVDSWAKLLRQNAPQMLAEAYSYYKDDTPLYLSAELEQQANEVQTAFADDAADPLIESIESYLNMLVPLNYEGMSRQERINWRRNDDDPLRPAGTMHLTTVTARQIIDELPGTDMKSDSRRDVRRVNTLMNYVEGWTRAGNLFDGRGVPREYRRPDGRVKQPWIRTTPVEDEGDL